LVLESRGSGEGGLGEVWKGKTLEIIKEMYADWAPEITEFLRQGDLQGLKQRTLYELPVGHQWEHKEGSTLIGDAASLSTPFSGEGVNKAMKDALKLAALIEKSQKIDKNLTLDQAVKLYEQKMFPWARKLQETTMMHKQNVFAPAALIASMTGMLTIVAKESSSIPMKVLGTRPLRSFTITSGFSSRLVGLYGHFGGEHEIFMAKWHERDISKGIENDAQHPHVQ